MIAGSAGRGAGATWTLAWGPLTATAARFTRKAYSAAAQVGGPPPPAAPAPAPAPAPMAPDAPAPLAAGAGRQTIWNQVPRGAAAATSSAALSSACSWARLRASGAGVPKTSESQGVP